MGASAGGYAAPSSAAHVSLLRPIPTAIVVGLIAAALSMIRSADVSFWTDEAITITAAERTWPQLFAMLGNVDAVHGAYYSVMKIWVGATGIDEWTLRSSSALFIGIAVAFTFLIGRMLQTARFGVLAATVLMLLPRATWAGIEARPWALTVAFAAVTSWVLLLGIRSPRTGTFSPTASWPQWARS